MHHTSLESEIILISSVDKRKAFSLAFNAFWEPLYQQAYRKVHSEQMAEDLTQETFMVFWDNIDKLAAQERLTPYLYAILRNKIIKIYEKDRVRLHYALSVTKAEDKEEPSPHQLLADKEMQGMINDELGRMPARMKEIYILKKDNSLSIKDIAEQLNLSEQTVKNQLQNAYHRLRKGLQDYNTSITVIYAFFNIFYILFNKK